MKEDFDLDKVGKKTPYKIPDSFLDEFTYVGIKKSDKERRKSSATIKFWKISFAAASVVFLLFSGIHLLKESGAQKINMNDTNIVNSQKDVIIKQLDVETVISTLSDEELKILSSMIEPDMFNQQ